MKLMLSLILLSLSWVVALKAARKLTIYLYDDVPTQSKMNDNVPLQMVG